jgi:peptidoglycan/xylan/chitin deacetylase (PgdA/CDA1 family)
MKYAKNNDNPINIEKSYNRMKKIRKFDKNLIVFKEKNNTDNTFVSIIVELSDTSYVDDILQMSKNKDVNITFFVNKNIFDNNIEIIKRILKSGNNIELSSFKYSIYEVNRYNSIIKLISDDKLSFCLVDNKNNSLINKCKDNHLEPILSSIDIKDDLYNRIKNVLQTGIIIKINNKKNNIKELSATINYIKQKGYKIVSLNKLFNK